VETFTKYVLKDINKGEVLEVLRCIKPLVRNEETDELNYVEWEGVDFYKTAFLWEPKIGLKATGLKECERIKSAHTFGAPVFFKPSLAECAAQIKKFLGNADAFEVITPENDDGIYFYLTKGGALLERYPVGHDPLNSNIEETLHKAQIVLYKKEQACSPASSQKLLPK